MVKVGSEGLTTGVSADLEQEPGTEAEALVMDMDDFLDQK